MKKQESQKTHKYELIVNVESNNNGGSYTIIKDDYPVEELIDLTDDDHMEIITAVIGVVEHLKQVHANKKKLSSLN